MNIKYYFLKLCQKVFSQPLIRSSTISRKSSIWNDSSIINCSIDDYSYISDHTSIYFTKIGKFCSIASYCSIGGASHPVDFASTSPVFLEGRNALGVNLAKCKYKPYKETIIGNDVWIGARCCIKSGFRIADGAVVGMGAVVVKDIGPYEIWAGNPAHFIRKRFPDETISKLLQSKWWNLPPRILKNAAKEVNSPIKFFMSIYEEENRHGEIS